MSCTKQLIDICSRFEKPTLSLKEISTDNLNKYGIVDGNLIESNICAFNHLIEKPRLDEAPSNLAMVG